MSKEKNTPDIEAQLAEIREGAYRFTSRLRGQAEMIIDEVIDPEGEIMSGLADYEGDAGALALAIPIELITFETWLLGQIGDKDQLDLDVPGHQQAWFNFGSWIGEALRRRHGGHWILLNQDPMTWRMGFSKILLEIAPYRFAAQLLGMGPGAARNLLGEIERLRLQHEERKEKDGGKSLDRFTQEHYVRMHTVPLGQWFVVEFKLMEELWNKSPAKELLKAVRQRKKEIGEENHGIVDQLIGALEQADLSKPLAEQTQDRGLFEAVTQVVAMKRATAPIAIDIMEKYVMPSMFIGVPEKFPPLDEDDIAAMRKGIELYELYVDVVPHKYQADDAGFLGCIPTEDLAPCYSGQESVDVGKGEWVIVNPKRFKEMLLELDSKRLLKTYDEFVTYIADQPDTPRRRDDGRLLAETVAKSLADIKACVVAGSKDGHNLLFRMLPPIP